MDVIRALGATLWKMFAADLFLTLSALSTVAALGLLLALLALLRLLAALLLATALRLAALGRAGALVAAVVVAVGRCRFGLDGRRRCGRCSRAAEPAKQARDHAAGRSGCGSRLACGRCLRSRLGGAFFAHGSGRRRHDAADGGLLAAAERLAHLRGLLRRGAFSFDEAVRGADRMTVAVTLFALLELYKRGEVDWAQEQSFGEISVRARSPDAAASSLPRAEAVAS